MTIRNSVLCLCFLLVGCASIRPHVGVDAVPLLPEDMIYSVPAGQAVNVLSDGKTTTITTTERMILTFQDVLVRQNQQANSRVLKGSLKGVAVGAVVPVLIIIGQILLRSRRKMKIEANMKAEA